MGSTDDKAIIQKIKQGELEHFSYIVHAYTKPIYTYVSKKLYEKEDADDIVQNVFLQFYKHIDTFDENAQILPYLYGIARNELKMYFRSKKTTVTLNEDVAADAEEIQDTNIEEALQLLPSEQQEPLKLLYEGYTYEEIATKLQKPVNTIKTIVRRTRLKLKKQHEKS